MLKELCCLLNDSKLKEVPYYYWFVVHWLAKYLLNMLALASNLVISSLLTSRGEILGTFFPVP